MALKFSDMDAGQLREVAHLLEVENDKLHRQLQKLSNKLDELQGTDARTLQLEIERLKKHLDGERNKHTAKKSERRHPNRRNAKKDREPETGGARNDQHALPVDRLLCELNDDQRQCPCCGGMADIMEGAYETSELIDVVEREFTVLKVERQKAVHGCACAPQKIVTAPGPVKLVPKGRFTLDFGVQLVVGKYHDHLPLELQATQMQRQGLDVRGDVLWNQIEYQAERWMPTVAAIRRAILESPAVGIDDTSWPMLALGRQNWAVFTLTTDQLTYLKIVRRKAHEQVMKLLEHPEGGAFDGILMCDGASNFTKACDELGTFELAHDWSHVRRKFFEAATDYPVANEVLDLIDELYDVERDAAAIVDMELHAARSKLRAARAAPLIQAIRKWLNSNATSWDGSDLNRAIRYADKRWSTLTLFLERPEVWLHNNGSEFALRKPVRGRKNFYGTKTRNGANVAAMAYTLCESARKNGINPAVYLREVFLRDVAEPGTVTLPQHLLN